MNRILYIFPIFLLRLQIIVVYYFFQTKFYALFVLLVILGFQCEIKNSYLHLFSQNVVWFALLSALFLSITLNFPFFGESAQSFIGKSFLNTYLPGPLKGFLPFSVFFFTFCLLNYLEAYTLHERILDYELSVEAMNHSLDQIASSSSDESILKDLQAAELQVYERLPKEFPSTGVLKDFSNSIILFIEGKK